MSHTVEQLLATKDARWRFPGSVYDNFCAYYTIASHDRSLLPPEAMAAILETLVALEEKPGGPYYNSFSKEQGDIDRKTNAAIARFLALYDIELPGLRDFLHTPSRTELPSPTRAVPLSNNEQQMFKKLRAALKKRFSSLEPAMRIQAYAVIERTIKGNPDRQMSLMPYYLREALGSKGERIPEATVVAMAVANVFFWTAFIIYDDFWDEDEAAQPGLLPIANLFARSYSDFFITLFPERSGFRAFFHDLMDKLDEANAWETRHCRAQKIPGGIRVPETLPAYRDYARKYRPASGHVLGPLGLLLISGQSLRSKEVTHLLDYFRYYLIAMQLNDDMHDWEEDLRRGHISTVVDLLIRDAGLAGKTINFEKDLPVLREVFWFTTLPAAAKKAIRYAKKSRRALEAMRSIEQRAPLERYIRITEKAARDALEEQMHSVRFIAAYGAT